MRSARFHLWLRGAVHLALLVSSALSSGCVSLAKSFPEKHFYSLDVVRQGEQVGPASGTVLKVQRFRISPRFEGKEMVYRTSDTRYESDFYNEWFISPNAMVTQQAQNWLANAGLFQAVVDSSSSLDATHVLEGSVTALYGDYRQKEAPKAVLDFQVVLINEGASHTEIVFRREYRQVVDMANMSPDTLASGWNEGLRQILAALEKDLRKVDLKANNLNPASGP